MRIDPSAFSGRQSTSEAPGVKLFSGGRRIWRARFSAISVLALVAGCAARQESLSPLMQAAQSESAVAEDLALIRATTARFTVLDSAVAAGYSRDGGRCLDNPPAGAMGYHHQNDALLDDRLEVERPEMLVYERLPDGSYRLNGVEYIVPYSVRPPTATPPRIMGLPLKQAPSLQLWYLHVWVWLENPKGLFADWHPQVRC